ncbi:MAG: hypothetical protein ACLR76_05405 [Alistipes sp.]
MEIEGLIMVSTHTDYRGQIRMEDPIVVTTCVDRIGHRALRSGNRSSIPAPAK